MSQDSELELDAEGLARLFVVGRSLKRLETINMVRELLKQLDDLRQAAAAAPIADGALRKMAASCRKEVDITPQNKIYLGPDVAGIYTMDEASAIAGRIVQRVEEVKNG